MSTETPDRQNSAQDTLTMMLGSDMLSGDFREAAGKLEGIMAELGDKLGVLFNQILAQFDPDGSLAARFGYHASGEGTETALERTVSASGVTITASNPSDGATVRPASYPSSSGSRTYEGDSIARQLGVGANNNGVNGLRLSQAGTPEFSNGDTVITSYGTNDAGLLIGASDARIEAWADQYGDYLASIQANGGNPVALDIRHATGAYTGNMAVWGQSGYVGRHNATVDRMNEALERELGSRGIAFVETNGRVEIGDDNLHPSARGAQQIQNLIQQELQGAQPPMAVASAPSPNAAMGG